MVKLGAAADDDESAALLPGGGSSRHAYAMSPVVFAAVPRRFTVARLPADCAGPAVASGAAAAHRSAWLLEPPQAQATSRAAEAAKRK